MLVYIPRGTLFRLVVTRGPWPTLFLYQAAKTSFFFPPHHGTQKITNSVRGNARIQCSVELRRSRSLCFAISLVQSAGVQLVVHSVQCCPKHEL